MIATYCFRRIKKGLQLDMSLIGQFKIKIFDWSIQRKNSKH